MGWKLFTVGIVTFLLAVLTLNLFSTAFTPDLRLIPASLGSSGGSVGVGEERNGPLDRISEDQIVVLPDRVIITVQGAVWSTFTDTNSMDPVIDVGANAIQIIPRSPEEIQVGDIISYESSLVSGTVIHRVVAIGEDGDGWYVRAQGDNNPSVDPEKIRFSQIKRVVVAIVY